jgi:hypothetical protein
MDKGKAAIAGRDVVTSGCVVAHEGEAVELFPFDDDPEYRLLVRIKYVDRIKESIINLKPDSESGASLVITDVFEYAHPVSTGSLNFAEDEDYEYFVTVTVLPIGTVDTHANVFTYTILRASKG